MAGRNRTQPVKAGQFRRTDETRIVDDKSGRQQIDDRDLRYPGIGLTHFKHHNKTVVLAHIRDRGRLTIQRVSAARDGEPVATCGQGRFRCRRSRDDRIHRITAAIDDQHRVCVKLIRRLAGVPGTGIGLSVNVERNGAVGRGNGTGRQHHPRVFLCGGLAAARAFGTDKADQIVNKTRSRRRFGCKGEDARPVP